MKSLLILALIVVAYPGQLTVTDWISCSQAGLKVIDDVQTIVDNVEKSGFDVHQIVAELNSTLDDIRSAEEACGIPEEYWIDFRINADPNSLQACIQDVQQLIAEVQQLQQDITNQNLPAVMADLQKLLTTVQALQTDCKNPFVLTSSKKTVNTNWLQCGQDFIVVYQQVVKLETDAKAKNINAVIQDLEGLLTDVQTLETDCGVKSSLIPSQFIIGGEPQNIQQCIQVIEQIVATAEQIKTDVQSLNLVALTKDIQSLYAEIQQAQQVCQQSTEAEKLTTMWSHKAVEEEPQVETNWTQCIGDLQTLYKEALQLQADVKAKDLNAVITDITSLYQEVQKLQVDCNVSQVEDQLPKTLQECLQAVEAIVATAQAVEADVQSLNIIALAKDVKTLISEIQYAQTVCKVSDYFM